MTVDAGRDGPARDADAGPLQLGKRYRCAMCDIELLCVKAGTGVFSCHGAPLEQVEMKPLPAGD